MSAQAGVFYFDGRRVPPDALARARRDIDAFGPDRQGELAAPGVRLIARALHVSPEDARERQPLVSARGNVITWDGRLDNREDLLVQLWREGGADTSDAALAMAAFERWGVGAFARLVGDWSLVVWERSRRALHLASDVIGVRPLYYTVDHECVRWSSTLGGLVEPVREIDEVDARFIVGYLTFAMPADVTPYPDVRSVPPAHVLSWSASGGHTRTRYWWFTEARLKAAEPRACAEELRRLLRDAVRVRLRSQAPVWAELSGGLDSSTLVCMARALLTHAPVDAPGLRTISYVSRSAIESDERPFIAEVEAAIGREGVHVLAESCIGAADRDRAWVTPLHVSDVGLEMLRAVVREGGRVVISGSPGDLVMGNFVDYGPAALDELFMNGSPRAMLRELRAWCRASQKTIWEVGGALLAELAPERRRARGAMRQTLASHGFRGRGGIEAGACDLFLLQPNAARRWIDEMAARAHRRYAWRDIPRRQLLEGIEQISESRRLQSPSEFPGVVMTFPYAHRPLLEFVLALPSKVLCAPGRPRALMHDAVDVLLPEKIRRRFSKGYAAPLLIRRNRQLAGELRGRIRELSLVQGGFVDAVRLERALARMEQGASQGPGNVSRIIDFERWMTMCRGLPRDRARMPA